MDFKIHAAVGLLGLASGMSFTQEINLNIKNSVKVSFDSEYGKSYKVYSTTDLSTNKWNLLGGPVSGSDDGIVFFHETENDQKLFFKAEQIQGNPDGSEAMLPDGFPAPTKEWPVVFWSPDSKPERFKGIAEGFDQLSDGSSLYFTGTHSLPPNRLKIQGKQHITIHGLGVNQLELSTPGDVLMIKDSSNIRVTGVLFKGKGPSPKMDDPYFAMIHLSGVNDRIEVSRCSFADFGSHGVSHLHGAKRSKNVTVSQCTFRNGGNAFHPKLNIDGTAISGIGSGWIVKNNTIENCLRGIEVEGRGIEQSQIIISGNHLRNIWNEGIMLFASSHESNFYSKIMISKNFVSCVSPRPDGVPHQTCIAMQGGENMVVSNNIIYNSPKAFTGIGLHSGMADIRNCVVEGNIVSGVGGWGIQVTEMAGKPYRCEGVVVTGNHVFDTGSSGMHISGSGHTVQGNLVKNCRSTGIIYSGLGEGPPTSITHNSVSGNLGKGIHLSSEAMHAIIAYNILSGNKEDKISANSKKNIIRDNISFNF
jgi:hypothetical protein